MTRRLSALLLAAFGALLSPFAVQAANLPLLSPGWAIVPTECQACACGFKEVLQLLQNLMNAGVSLSVVIMVIAITYAGVLFLLSPTNPENRNKGKTALTSAVIGMTIVLAAWVTIDFIMKLLYGGAFGPWNNILGTGTDACVQAVQTQPLFNGVINAPNIIPGDPGTYTGGSSSGGGTCTVPTDSNNPCSVQSLSSTCFAALGEAASRVCNLESAGGQVAIPSGSDKLDSGRGPSYSWGLWQINLTTTNTAAAGWGMDCRQAFSGPCSGDAIHVQGGKVGWCSRTITDQALYSKCVAAAQNPQNNTKAACQLYNSTLSAWSCSASRCHVQGARVLSGACAPS